MLYNVEFTDGVVKQYSANIFAENMYSKSTPKGGNIIFSILLLTIPRKEELFRKEMSLLSQE